MHFLSQLNKVKIRILNSNKATNKIEFMLVSEIYVNLNLNIKKFLLHKFQFSLDDL